MYVVAVQIHSAHSARPPFKSYAAWRDESSGFFGPFHAIPRTGTGTGTPILSLTLREEPNKRAQRAPSPRPLVLLATPNSF